MNDFLELWEKERKASLLICGKTLEIVSCCKSKLYAIGPREWDTFCITFKFDEYVRNAIEEECKKKIDELSDEERIKGSLVIGMLAVPIQSSGYHLEKYDWGDGMFLIAHFISYGDKGHYPEFLRETEKQREEDWKKGIIH
jgi:hypothetical protein